MGRTIGIDLGTSRTCAAIVRNGRPEVLRSAMGYTTIPSVLTFDDAGAPVVGQKAERQMALRPQDTIYGSKRLLGRAYLKGVKARFQPHFTYELVELDGQVAARVCGRVISLTEVAARILAEVRAAAESALGEPVDRAVITVPAYFTDPQRACVKQAGKLANLEVLRTINEPTAAALAFGTRQTQRKKVLVYDLGGGTFDVSIVDIDGAYYKVLGVDGDTFLGGLDFDVAMAGVLSDRLADKHGDLFALTLQSQERLREAAEDAKQRLSTEEVAQVQLLQLELGTGEHIDVNETVTRSELERASAPLVEKTLDIVSRALDSVGVTADQIDDLLLVGGQSRMPLVHARLEQMFGRPPSKRVHPDEVVAIGAAIAADSLNREGAPVLVDVLPMAIGVGHADDEFEVVVPKNSAVPCQGHTGFVIPADATRFALSVYQGNSRRTSENAYLGRLDLPDLPASADKRTGQLELALDGEGMLQITVTVPALRLARTIQLTTRAPVTTADHDIDHVPVAVRRAKTVDQAGGGTSSRAGWWTRLLRALRLSR